MRPLLVRPRMLYLERQARLRGFEQTAGLPRSACEADFQKWRALVPRAELTHKMRRNSMIGAGMHPELAPALLRSPILSLVGKSEAAIVNLHVQDLLALGGLR